MIIKSVDELKGLVDEFSNFARMPASSRQPNDLNDIMKEALTLYEEAHRSITFTVKADDNVPHLLLDRDQIKRVLINLLDNAVAAIERRRNITLQSTTTRT